MIFILWIESGIKRMRGDEIEIEEGEASWY